MNFIPSPLVKSDPNNRAFGRKLAKLIATMRRIEPRQKPRRRFRNGMQALADWEGQGQ